MGGGRERKRDSVWGVYFGIPAICIFLSVPLHLIKCYFDGWETTLNFLYEYFFFILYKCTDKCFFVFLSLGWVLIYMNTKNKYPSDFIITYNIRLEKYDLVKTVFCLILLSFCTVAGGTPDYRLFIQINFRNLKLAIISQKDIFQWRLLRWQVWKRGFLIHWQKHVFSSSRYWISDNVSKLYGRIAKNIECTKRIISYNYDNARLDWHVSLFFHIRNSFSF